MVLNNSDLQWSTRKRCNHREFDSDVVVKMSAPAKGSKRIVISFKATKAEDVFTAACLREKSVVYAIKKNRIYFAEVEDVGGYTLAKSGLCYVMSRRVEDNDEAFEFIGDYELKWSDDRELWYIEKEARA